MAEEKDTEGRDSGPEPAADAVRLEVAGAPPLNPAHEALAGALAKWDLVPAADLIRRT